MRSLIVGSLRNISARGNNQRLDASFESCSSRLRLRGVRRGRRVSSANRINRSNGLAHEGQEMRRSWVQWFASNMWFRRGLRALRIGVVSFGLYRIGYSNGVDDYVRDPDKQDQRMVSRTLRSEECPGYETVHSNGFDNSTKVDLRTGKTAEGSMSSEMATVQRVGNRLISAARLHVKDVLMASSSLAMGEVVKLKDRDVTVVRLYTGVAGSRDALYVIADQPSTLDTFWWSLQKMAMQLTTKKVVQDVPITRRDTSEMAATEAAILPKLSPGQCVVPRHELQSAHDDMLATSLRVLERRWNFFIFESPDPNAFVDGLNVFIASALVRGFCSNDDELAMLMGHELAHTILHHGGQDWSNMATALIVQLLLLSVLDSTGVGTLFWELFGTGTIFCTLSFKRFAFLVPSTRACESEADLLGLDLVSKARYNPSRAVDLFQRFKAFERTHGVYGNRVWDSNHPPTAERVAAILKATPNAMLAYQAAGGSVVNHELSEKEKEDESTSLNRNKFSHLRR